MQALALLTRSGTVALRDFPSRQMKSTRKRRAFQQRKPALRAGKRLERVHELARRNRKVAHADATVELAKAEFEHYNTLFEAGSITKKDLTQSQANVLQKEAAQLAAQLSVNTAKTTLRQLLELPESEAFEVSAPESEIQTPDALTPIPTLDALQATATETNPGLKSDSLAIQVAKKNTEIAGKGKSIKVSLGASASTGLQAWESKKYGSQLKNGYSHSVSLNINIPIIDGGATENKVLQAQISETESQVALKEQAKTPKQYRKTLPERTQRRHAVESCNPPGRSGKRSLAGRRRTT